MKLEGKNILLTGADGGIGSRIIKELLLRNIGKIYAATIDLSLLDEKLLKENPNIVPIVVDITDEKSVKLAADQCKDVDVLFNNAGVNFNISPIKEASFNKAKKEMEVNYFGAYLMCNAFIPALIERGEAKIVNMCSILSYVSMPVDGTYAASKAALHSYTQSIRGELRDKNVTVLGIYPGPVDTVMTEGLEMPKATPEKVAFEIVEAIENDAIRVMPCDYSKFLYAGMMEDYEKVEDELSYYI